MSSGTNKPVGKEANVRAWCLTINNYTNENVEDLKKLKYLYLIIGNEVGASGTKHLQVFVRMTSQTPFKRMKNRFPTAHLEPAKGSDLQNKEYCSKEEVLFEDGTPSQQGKRTDIDDIKEAMSNVETANLRHIIPICRSIQSVRMAEIHLTYFEPKRDWKPKVKWYYGATGTGKTHQAHKEAGEEPVYVCMATTKWWQGYDGHKYVIIDDMRKDFCKFHDLLRMLDRYSYTVENKGGTRQLLAKTIVITTTKHPTELYGGREDVRQLTRRIDEIREFKNTYKPEESEMENVII